MKTDNLIKLAVGEILQAAEFQRKSNTWFRVSEEAILVVDLQKSNFGKQYYINLGIIVKSILKDQVANSSPKESDCHIRIRVEAIKPNEQDKLKRLLNLEDDSIAEDERQDGIKAAISNIALPFLIECSTRQGIRNAEAKGQLKSSLLTKSIRDTILA